jgi:hypothetical protein
MVRGPRGEGTKVLVLSMTTKATPLQDLVTVAFALARDGLSPGGPCSSLPPRPYFFRMTIENVSAHALTFFVQSASKHYTTLDLLVENYRSFGFKVFLVRLQQNAAMYQDGHNRRFINSTSRVFVLIFVLVFYPSALDRGVQPATNEIST